MIYPQCGEIHLSGTVCRIKVVIVKMIHLVNKYVLTEYLCLHDRKLWPQEIEPWKMSSGLVLADLQSHGIQNTPCHLG